MPKTGYSALAILIIAALCFFAQSSNSVSAELDCVVPYAAGTISGPIYELKSVNGTLVASAARGLFHVYSDTTGGMRPIAGGSGRLTTFVKEVGDRWYVATEVGLYEFDGVRGEVRPVGSGADLGLVKDILHDGNVTFIAAQKGLARLNADAVVIEVSRDATRLIPLDGEVYAAIDGAFYALRKGVWQQMTAPLPTIYVVEKHPSFPNAFVVGADPGVFFVQKLDGQLKVFAVDQYVPPIGLVLDILTRPGQLLIGSRTGVFWLSTESLRAATAKRIPSYIYRDVDAPVRFDTQLVYDVFDAPAFTLAASDQGLFRLNGDILRKIPTSGAPGPIFQVFSGGRKILLPSREGIFEYTSEIIDENGIERADKKRLIVGRAADGIRITVDLGKCALAASEIALNWQLSSLKGKGQKGRATFVRTDHNKASYDIVFEAFNAEEIGNHTLQIYGVASDGSIVKLGSVDLSVTRDWLGLILSLFAFAGVSSAAGHLLFFTTLIVLAPKQNWAFNTLFDSRFGKGRIYFGAVLSRSKMLQLYVFSSAYRSLRAYWLQASLETYHAVPIRSADGSVRSSDQLLNILCQNRRVCLCGEAGKGKSAAVEFIARSYFATDTLFRAWQETKVFLIPVRLRYLRRVDDRDLDWLVRALQVTLSEFGWEITDEALLKTLVTSGFFAFCLDGMNEIDRDDDLLLVSKEAPRVAILYTTRGRTLPGFIRYNLPEDLSKHASGILSSRYGSETAKALLDALSPNLLDELKSGFEIVILAVLYISSGRVPSRRLDLYDMIVDQAQTQGLNIVLDRALSRCAWELWQKDERRLDGAGGLSEGDLGILEDVKIVSFHSGKYCEFSHDQMRGFFAARWLTTHLGVVSMIRSALESPPIWGLAPAVQREMFEFLGEQLVRRMVAGDLRMTDLESLGQFAVASDVRWALQHEIARAAGAHGVPIKVELGH
ncbi:hypothetical protein GOL75_25630 [Sinorhizobium medicae]|nr:hypothetical protein [Sinorhizobium medicae]MDX0907185.1 hypothetical protein [Sinorhizobium medicae]MDX1164638.1 hypothetical protein [Sinorhizobium medicae]